MQARSGVSIFLATISLSCFRLALCARLHSTAAQQKRRPGIASRATGLLCPRSTPRHMKKLFERFEKRKTQPSAMGCAQSTPAGDQPAEVQRDTKASSSK